MIVASPSSVGETLVVLGLSSYLRKTQGKLTLLLRAEHQSLLKYFDLEGITLKFGTLTQIRNYAVANGFGVSERSKKSVSIDPFSNGDLALFKKIIERECSWTPVSYIKWCLGVPDHVSVSLPVAESKVVKDCAGVENMIFFSVGSNTNTPMPARLIKVLTDQLANEGCRFFYNIQGAHHFPLIRFPESEVRFDLSDAVNVFLNSAGGFVSSSGLGGLLGSLQSTVRKPPLWVIKTDQIRVEENGHVVDKEIFGNSNFRSYIPNETQMISDLDRYFEIDVAVKSSVMQCDLIANEMLECFRHLRNS